MSVLNAMQSAAIRLVGSRPSVFFSSQNQFEQEIVDLVNEAATDIVKYQDWQTLVRIATFNGDGVSEGFDMPSDYDRMMVASEIQDLNNWVWGYAYADSIDQFLYMKARGFGPYPGIWTVYDDQFKFTPVSPVGQNATFPYITKNYARGADDTDKSSFNKDDDEFRIKGGERLLTMWLVWRWRENKKMDSTGDQENFAKALDELAAKDRGSRVYRSSTSRIHGNFRPAWPYLLG